MAEIGSVNVSIAWAHLHVRGGVRNLVTTTCGYAALIIGLLVLSTRVDPKETTHVMQVWTVSLAALNCAVLILVGCGAVRAAVRKDIASQMMESHRLMPIGAAWAVGGYMLGPLAQVFTLFAANLAIGCITAVVGQLSLADWLLVNCVLLAFALCAWTVAVYYAYLTRMGLVLLLVPAAILCTNEGELLGYIPGLSVLLTPISGRTIFEPLVSGRAPGSTALTALCGGLFGQAALACICFIAAMRKYRRDDILSMGALLGLALLAWWVLISGWTITNWAEVEPRWLRFRGIRSADQTVSSALAGMLLAVLPLAGNAWQEREWRRRLRAEDIDRPARPVPMILIAAAVTCLLLLLPVMGVSSNRAELFKSTLVFCFFALSSGFLMRIVYRRNKYPILIPAMWIGATWLGPWLAEGIRISLAEHASDSILPTLSPVGTLVVLWTGRSTDTTIGLVFQGVIMIAFGALYYATRQRPGTLKPQPAGLSVKAEEEK